MLERDIEARSKRYARAKGDYVRKFSSPSNRSVPDDIFITEGHIWFCEFKATGKTLTPLQSEEHKSIIDAGGLVYTIDSIAEFKRIRDEIAYGASWPIGFYGDDRVSN